ncbi:MAG: hypothetical protein R3F60_32430 [bacterium]
MPGNEVELPELFAPELDEREDDVRAGQAILDELVPTLAALPPSPFPAGVPLGRAALAALRRVEQVDAPGLRAPADDADTTLRADLALLPARLWRADCVEDTRRYALALLAARRQAATARAGQSAAALPVALLAAATEVRGRMMALLSYHLGDDAAVGPTLRSIAAGAGHLDLADDLARLAGLHAAHDAALRDDRRHYRADDASRARQLATQITRALTGGPAGDDAPARVPKVFALLEAAHEELTRGLRFVQPGMAWPTLRGAARRR